MKPTQKPTQCLVKLDHGPEAAIASWIAAPQFCPSQAAFKA
ncbi:hypothetical protein [Thermoleptolyngbya sp. M55_K2018_002]|nr:hypothetical protein [Thermoleptolyngbya sp. M55_K2018_002]